MSGWVDCMDWPRGVAAKTGYGRCYNPADGKTWYAHRLAWVQQVGPIPEGMQLDHKCKNRKCVNVAHLRLVSHAENVAGENSESPSARNKRKTHCIHGHAFTPENIFVVSTRPNTRNCRTCLRIAAQRRAA